MHFASGGGGGGRRKMLGAVTGTPGTPKIEPTNVPINWVTALKNPPITLEMTDIKLSKPCR